MKDVIRRLIFSSKNILALAGVVSALALKLGLDIPTADVAAILSPLIAAIFSQGLKDLGVRAAEVQNGH